MGEHGLLGVQSRPYTIVGTFEHNSRVYKHTTYVSTTYLSLTCFVMLDWIIFTYLLVQYYNYIRTRLRFLTVLLLTSISWFMFPSIK